MIKPELYAPSTSAFWDDEHISKGMLEAHLDPNWEAASRKHEFIDESVKWIESIAPSSQYRELLDLGCGPGLYAERFSNIGYSVTGRTMKQVPFGVKIHISAWNRFTNMAIERNCANVL